MGMYSWFQYQHNLKIDPNKVVDEEKIKNLSLGLVTIKEENEERYVDFEEFTDIKLYGYFYDDQMELLHYVANICLLDEEPHNEEPHNNFIEYSYEEGFRFRILFFISKEIRKNTWGVLTQTWDSDHLQFVN